MPRYRVLGYDAAGREVLSLAVEVMDEQDATLTALRIVVSASGGEKQPSALARLHLAQQSCRI